MDRARVGSRKQSGNALWDAVMAAPLTSSTRLFIGHDGANSLCDFYLVFLLFATRDVSAVDKLPYCY